ncbi:response regulator transcription factor [Glutamicibacter sp. MNS18]|uniref:response regulator transcription factor n=1 Tax=Glutamicibacter sp. MNS18 TaxID=2989817 RepID=UPI002236607E|nr:response regulator transcription factor [Glutamicibacter sp. MNS18]MCW4465747.1 response regulator transcription factor [Glutamicibacter sp. MNS18]
MNTTSAASVLLVDDEQDILATLGGYLRRSGLEVLTAGNGVEALQVMDRHPVQVIVSDVMMPFLDGRSLLRTLRQREDWTPVILLTVVGEADERSAALDEGADDYLNKPFAPQELLSRIRAVLRRLQTSTHALGNAQILVADHGTGTLKLDRLARRVWNEDTEIMLTPKALTLLEYLMTRPDEVHSRERLLESLWGFEFAVSTRAVDHRIAEIRKAFGDDAAAPTLVQTVAGQGYRFAGEVRRG